MKVGIIGGAGLLGSTIAFVVAQRALVDEIVLIDIKENLAQAHMMDMGQANSEHNQTAITYGSWDALADCDIVIMTASKPERKVASRNEYLTDNLSIVRSVAGYIAQYCPNAAFINATNPLDPFNYIFCKLSGMPARQFVGFSRNDTLRLCWALGRVLNVPTTDIEALVIGEHGEGQVPVFSSVKVKGIPTTLTSEQQNEAYELIQNWFRNYQALQSGRTSGWTSALGVAHLVEAMVKQTEEILPCSAMLHGEYGISDVSIGVPVVLGPKGIERIVELPLTAKETQGLHDAALKVSNILNDVKWK